MRVHAIFESSTTSAPTLPQLTLVNRSANLTDTIKGEILIGSNSGAVARVVESTASTVDIVFMNELRFSVSEPVVFQSSGISGEVSQVVVGDKNILNDFSFDNGQRAEFYDYARIIRDGVVVYSGEILSVYREKNQVKEVGTGLECGISIKDFIDFKEKDVIESYLAEEIQRSI